MFSKLENLLAPLLAKKYVWAVFLILLFLVFGALIFVYTKNTNLYIKDLNTESIDSQSKIFDYIKKHARHKHEPIKVKALYITAYSASSMSKIDEMIDLIDKTELNAIVIDIKDYSGYILYDTKIPLANELKLKNVLIRRLPEILKKMKEHNIYTIARISSFQDPILAENKPEWALKSKATGALWRDKKGLAWVDANNKNVWSYIVSVGREASRLGFDEVNFDYIRFPTDGNLSDIAYTNGDKKRYEVMSEFYSYLSASMGREPVYISADLFGLTTERTGEDDMMIGQRIMDAAQYFDYVCPMVYPSHYPTGYMNFSNPADHPYEVVYNAMKKGVDRTNGMRAKLRTWVQYFNLGAVYDGDKVRAQIKASDESGADGWMLWNARNVYDGRGILSE